MSVTGKALWIIERNLGRELSLDRLAKLCEVSRFHLAHAFGEATGRPVMDYVRGRRLSKAAGLLAAGAKDILDIALDSGYASHEAFTRAFGAQFGLTPEEVRRNRSVRGLALVEPIHLDPSHDIPLDPPRIEKAGTLQFVGLSEPLSYDAVEHIPKQWQIFMSRYFGRIEHLAQPIPVGISTGCENDLRYVCAAEVSRFANVPTELVTLSVAPATYAVFDHFGHISTLHQTYVAIWDGWFASSGQQPKLAPSLERHNPTFDPRTGNGGVTIWIAIED